MPANFPLPAAGGGYSPSGMLDGPPVNPVTPGPQQMPGAMSSSRQLPPEVLQGITQSVNTMLGMCDSLASMVPDLASDLAFAKSGLTQFQQKVLLAGGSPSTAAQAGTPMPNGIPPSPSPTM